LYTLQRMNFERVKLDVDPIYLPFIEFLESLEVADVLTDEPPLAFQFGNLMQNWKLQTIKHNGNDFAIMCNKESNSVGIESVTNHCVYDKFKGVRDENSLINYLELKHGVKIDKLNSTIHDSAPKFKFFCYLSFDETLTIDQVTGIYRDLFLEKGVEESV